MQYTEIVLSSKNEHFQYKRFDIFLMFAQNIAECGSTLEPPRRGGSNEYPQSMFWSKKKKIGNPCIPQFCFIKVGFKGWSFVSRFEKDHHYFLNRFVCVGEFFDG